MTLDDLDKLFSFLYRKGHEYTKYTDIKSECFPEDSTMDVEGMTIKMHKDGYLDSGAIRNNDVIEGYRQQGIYKLSFEGRMAFENCTKRFTGRPYKYAEARKRRSDRFKKVKIIAAVLNSILILGIAAIGLRQTYKTNKQEQQITSLSHMVDSLQQVIFKNRLH